MHKQAHDKRNSVESYINRARLAVCEVSVFFKNLPTLLFEELLKFTNSIIAMLRMHIKNIYFCVSPDK